MKRRLLAADILLLIAAATLSQVAVANFNAATGFSGRHGFTCTSCHNVPDMGPLGDEPIYDPPAEVTLEGLPPQWDLGQSYELTITVTGGPPALPSPAPQGGFEIEANEGAFGVPEGMEEFIEVYAEDGSAVTYTADGTQMRQWRVWWSTPIVPPGPNVDVHWGSRLTSAPDNATFWVAAMAANGNHVVAAEASDGGELGDSVDNITVTVPPSQAAIDAWDAYRLLPPLPTDDDQDIVVGAFEPFTVSGQHRDPDATHLGYTLDGGAWERIATQGTGWRLEFGNGLTPGEHDLWVRSESDDRVSDPVAITIRAEDADMDAVQTPFPSLLVIGGLLAAVGWRRMR